MRTVVEFAGLGLFALACGGSSDQGIFQEGVGGASSTGGSTSEGGSSNMGGSHGGSMSEGGTASGGVGAGGVSAAGASGASSAGPCDSDLDCVPAGLLCDTVQARCVQCVRDADCGGASLRCRASSCVEVAACTNSLDCVSVSGGRTICDTFVGECVQCLTPSDCSDTADCVANTCVAFTPCVNSLDCSGEVCDTSAGRCVDCLRDEDCAVGQVCRTQACEAATCVPDTCAGRCGSIPDGCNAQLDCGPCGTHCTNGLQDADELGVDCGGIDCSTCPVVAGAWTQCTADTDCVDGRVCSKATQEIVAPGRWGFCTRSCQTQADCTDPAPPGGETPTCLGAGLYCAVPCTGTGICPATMECMPGITGAVCRHALM